MTTGELLRVVLRWWWLVLVGVIAGTIAGATLLPTASASFISTASVAVTPTERGTGTPAETYSTQLVALNRAGGYARIAGGEDRLEELAEEIDVDPGVLVDEIEVEAPTGTPVISITVTADSAADAQTVAEGLVDSAVDTIRSGERRPNRDPLLRPVVTNEASTAAAGPEPAAWRNPTYGALGGLLLGLAMAVLAGRADPRIRDSRSVEMLTSAPVLGVLNIGSSAGRRRSAPRQAPDLSMHRLRTTLLFALTGEGPGTLALLAADLPVTREAVVLPLGRALSNTGSSVLLVEGDVGPAPPSKAHEPKTDGRLSLADCVDGGATLAEAVVHLENGVDLLRAPEDGVDGDADDAEGRLHSRAFGAFLERASAHYDVVVVTTAPTTVSTAAAAVAARCAGTVVTIRLGHTTRRDLSDTIRQLNQVRARVLGVVLLR